MCVRVCMCLNIKCSSNYECNLPFLKSEMCILMDGLVLPSVSQCLRCAPLIHTSLWYHGQDDDQAREQPAQTANSTKLTRATKKVPRRKTKQKKEHNNQLTLLNSNNKNATDDTVYHAYNFIRTSVPYLQRAQIIYVRSFPFLLLLLLFLSFKCVSVCPSRLSFFKIEFNFEIEYFFCIYVVHACLFTMLIFERHSALFALNNFSFFHRLQTNQL